MNVSPVRRRRGPQPSGTLFDLDVIDLQILKQIADGSSNADIMANLYLSASTVERRLHRAQLIMGARNRAHLAALHVRHHEGGRVSK